MQAMPLRNRRPPQPSAACHGSASAAGQTASPQPSSSSPRQTRGPRETPPKARKCMRPGHNEAHLEEQHVAQQELADEKKNEPQESEPARRRSGALARTPPRIAPPRHEAQSTALVAISIGYMRAVQQSECQLRNAAMPLSQNGSYWFHSITR